ncbi:MAG: PAS domain-containing protein [Rhodocyclaceae bacterium]|nr:MAG: PAS domain-containing protein [Rhodocyclaceae bacterium]
MISSFARQSLKTKIAVSALLIFLISIWLLTLGVLQILHSSLGQLLGLQLVSTASLAAASLEDELQDRMRLLELTAAQVSPPLIKDAQALQRFLDGRAGLRAMFNAGTIVTGRDGVAIASVPFLKERVGVDYMFSGHIAAALKDGRSTVGKPGIGKALGVPVVAIASPIRDTEGKIIGAIAGIVDLGGPNFLDKIMANHYGVAGGYVLVAPQHQLVVVATDKSLVLRKLPAADAGTASGLAGPGAGVPAIAVSLSGVEVLRASSWVPLANWQLIVELPTSEAFAPIRELRLQIFLLAGVLTFLGCGAAWWLLRHLFDPLVQATNSLISMSGPGGNTTALLPSGKHEVGQLVGAFNSLLTKLQTQAKAMANSEADLRWLIESSPVPMMIVAPPPVSQVILLNTQFVEQFGYTSADISDIATFWSAVVPDPNERAEMFARWDEAIRMAEASNGSHLVEPIVGKIRRKDWAERYVEVDVTLRGDSRLVVFKDITLRREVETAMQERTRTLEEEVERRTKHLRVLSAALMTVEERERRFLAEELHDHLAQLLGTILLKLSVIKPESDAAKIGEIRELVMMAAKSTRSIMLEMRPPILNTLGLAPSLRFLAEEMDRLYSLRVFVDIAEEPGPLLDQAQAVLYRCAKEILVNVAKHARTSEATVRCMADENGSLTLVVSDLGCGFDTSDVDRRSASKQGFGLHSVIERIANIGGETIIDSQLGAGTSITIRLPWHLVAKST